MSGAKVRPTALIILDGIGLNPSERGNAVAAARKPVLDKLWASCPHAVLQASGEAVGLMDGQMGDSNVGHLNLGAGRIVYQYVQRIRKAIADGSFFENEALVGAIEAAAAAPSRSLHLLGLVSPGGVHSHSDHLIGLLELAKRRGVGKVYVHAFTDGRDVPPKSGLGFIQELENEMARLGVGRLASVGGRYFGMDRDRRWERTGRAYEALLGRSSHQAPSGPAAVEAAYERGETDEFIAPTVIVDGGEPVGAVRPDDVVIFFNFRADRARQLCRMFLEDEPAEFERPGGRVPVHLTTMTRYDERFEAPYAYGPPVLENTLGEVVSAQGWRQLRVAETEKYAHVTFFFSGGREQPFPGEEQRLIPSPKVATYDLKPEMSAPELADTVSQAVRQGGHELIVLNFANGDMVGHTGVFEAAVKAVEAVDAALGRVLEALDEAGGQAIVTADHGNADEMLDDQGGPHTFHTLHPVPIFLVGGRPGDRLRDGILADVAPTVLHLMGVPKPPEMTGESLLIREGA